jgi:hypothetical protein
MQAGFGDTGFFPNVRLLANYGQGGHTSVNEYYKNSRGYKNAYYYSGDKYRDFAYSSSEYMHDFLGHVRGYDHAYIDGVEVFCEDEEPPSITWVKGYDIGERTFAFSEKKVNIRKRRLSSVVNGCGDEGVVIEFDGSGEDGVVGGTVWNVEGIPFEETLNTG